MVYALVGGTVVDGTGADPKPKTTVVVEGSKIRDLTDRTDFGGDVQVFDVSGKTVMPGLIDCHLHFATWHMFLSTRQNQSLMYHACETVKAMKLALEVGCTTCRDAGMLDRGFVDAQAAGVIEGPRIQAAVCLIQSTNGLTAWMPPWGGTMTPMGSHVLMPGSPSSFADGVDGLRAKVREVLRCGAQVIKFTNTGWGEHLVRGGGPLFTKEEAKAIVDEAHRGGVKATCHAVSPNPQAMLEAVQAGADSIDHGVPMTDEIADEMAKRGTFWIPTCFIYKFHAEHDPVPAMKEMMKRMWDEDFPKAMDWALKKGVRVAMGTDLAYGGDMIGVELKHMVDVGMSPKKAIEVSTRGGAELLGMEDLVGTLAPGKEADLLIVDGDPLEDISLLSRLEALLLVMQGGKPVAGPMKSQFPVECPELPWYQAA